MRQKWGDFLLYMRQYAQWEEEDELLSWSGMKIFCPGNGHDFVTTIVAHFFHQMFWAEKMSC